MNTSPSEVFIARLFVGLDPGLPELALWQATLATDLTLDGTNYLQCHFEFSEN